MQGEAVYEGALTRPVAWLGEDHHCRADLRGHDDRLSDFRYIGRYQAPVTIAPAKVAEQHCEQVPSRLCLKSLEEPATESVIAVERCTNLGRIETRVVPSLWHS